MRLALALVVAMTSVAHAQAPGEVPAAPSPNAPAPGAPTPGAPAPSAMDRRWAVALSLSGEGMTPDGGSSTGLGVLELAGRYRVADKIELGLAIDAGGGGSGKLTTGGLYADLRYSLMPGQPWNVLFLGSLGAASVYGKNAADVDRKGRGSVRIGAGIERRFGAWAIEGDLRVVSIAENRDVPVVYPTTTEFLVARYGVSGAALTLAGTFYW